jgi:hypothetical protein
MTVRLWREPASTSSLRAQRSNPESLRGDSLDCFVASAQNCFAILSRAPRNDGASGIGIAPQLASQSQTHHRSLAAHLARALLQSRPLFKQGAGKAGCRLAPTVRCARVAHGEMHSGIQVKPNTRPSLRSGLTAYAVLSREPSSFWPPSPRELTMRLTRLGAPHLRKRLGRSNDGQDHTVLPYALSAVRQHVDTDSQGLPALPAPLVPTLPRPPQPGPRFERLANRPSSWAGLCRLMPQFRISVKWNIFAQRGLTEGEVFCPTGRV